MKKDPTFRWDDKDYVEMYENTANDIIVERKRSISIMLEIIDFHFPDLSGLNILDIGCGDGILSRLIQCRAPENHFHLMDASAEMLEKAKESFKEGNTTYYHRSFEDYVEMVPAEHKYNLVISSNAIHHLEMIKKAELFSMIHRELKYGGLFLNIDPVHPNSAYSEKIQFHLWKNWINETLEKKGDSDDTRKYDNIDSLFKDNYENKPSTLKDQLDALRRCGFRDVDCFYKYSLFAVFGGTKM